LCGDFLSEVTGLDDAKYKALQGKFAGIQIVSIDVTVNGDQAVATVNESSGPPADIFKLTRDGKQWKICSRA
jgi:hypothetical protein